MMSRSRKGEETRVVVDDSQEWMGRRGSGWLRVGRGRICDRKRERRMTKSRKAAVSVTR
jgi:hypothetical protein